MLDFTPGFVQLNYVYDAVVSFAGLIFTPLKRTFGGIQSTPANNKRNHKGGVEKEKEKNDLQSTSAKNGAGRGRSGRDGNGSDDDDDGDDMFKKIRKDATRIAKYEGRYFVKHGKFWLSRDKAYHGGSYCKVYVESGRKLQFVGSVPKRIFRAGYQPDPKIEDFAIMTGKHESHKLEIILMKDLISVK